MSPKKNKSPKGSQNLKGTPEEIVNKTREMSTILLNEYITTMFQYTLLKRCDEDKNLHDRFKSTKTAHAPNLIISTLFNETIKSICNILFDIDCRSASIYHIKNTLEKYPDLFGKMMGAKEIVFVFNNIDDKNKKTEHILQKQRVNFRKEYEENFKELKNSFSAFKNSEVKNKIYDIRNKAVAHIDVINGEKLKRVTRADFGLDLNDLDKIIKDTQHIVDLAYRCCAQETYQFGHIQRQFESIAKDFWDGTGRPPEKEEVPAT